MPPAVVRSGALGGIPAAPPTTGSQEPLPAVAPTAPPAARPVRSHPRAGRFAKGYAVAVLLLGTGAFTSLVPFDPQAPVFALWFLAYGVAAAGLLDDVFRTRRALSVPLPLLAFVLLAAASVFWSVAPEISLRRAVGLTGTVAVGLFLARRLAPVDLFDALRRAVLVVAVASLLLYASGSPLALDEIHGTLRGVLSTKNTLGRILALGVLAAAFVYLADRSGPRRRRAVVSGLVMLAALALTDSTGGVLVSAAVLAVAVPLALVRHRRAMLAVAALATAGLAALVVLLAATTPEEAAGAIGEDVTLTGRTDIWSESLDAMAEEPVIGYGYGAFWDEDGAVESDRIRGRLQWEVPNAHNGLLDIGLDLGVVGAAVAATVLLTVLARGVVDLSRGSYQTAALRLSIGAISVVVNIAETGLLQQNSLYTVLLVAALAAAAVVPPSPSTTVRGPGTR
jgi:exopolysaccharide production protein ExoQ